eukprot:6180522-Pleurochrysis_carterae.AAC.2
MDARTRTGILIFTHMRSPKEAGGHMNGTAMRGESRLEKAVIPAAGAQFYNEVCARADACVRRCVNTHVHAYGRMGVSSAVRACARARAWVRTHAAACMYTRALAPHRRCRRHRTRAACPR